MAKKNGSRKNRPEANKIRKAERKLAKALAEVDEARAKVARRQRKLSALLARHGPVASAESVETIAVEGDDGATDKPGATAQDDGDEAHAERAAADEEEREEPA